MDRTDIEKLIKNSKIEFINQLQAKINNAHKDYMEFSINLDDKNKFELKRFFHSIKGTAGTLGFDNLYNLGVKYESIVANINPTNKESLFQIIEGITYVYKEYLLLNDEINSQLSNNCDIITTPKIFMASSFINDSINNLTIKSNIKNILIIDNDNESLNNLNNSLCNYDFNVITTNTHENVISILQKNKIDVILLDIFLDNHNGISLDKEIQGQGFLIPILFMSHNELMGNFLQKNNNFISKSIDKLPLISKINEVIASSNQNIKQQSDKQKILIIGDENIIINLIKGILSLDKYEIYTANDGESGLNQFNNINPQLVIIDLMLPKINGFDLCQTIKNIKRDTKVLVISARKREEDIVRCFDIGVDDYVTKPFSLPELQLRIKKLL